MTERQILKRKDTPESRAYWASVERAAREWRDECPDWAREQFGLPPREQAPTVRLEAIRALIEEWREYRATSQAEARKTARRGDLADQRSRQAEVGVLNVCISELEALVSQETAPTKDRA